MTRLMVNGIAASRSSRGVARYAHKVISGLEWPAPIERLGPGRWAGLDKLRELTFRAAPGTVLWSPTHRGPVIGANHVVTVHDCINVEFVYAGDWREPVLRGLTQRMLENAYRVVAISEATREALFRNYRLDESRVSIIRSSCEQDLTSIDISLIPEAVDMTADLLGAGPYALMVTNALPHKNTAFACKALSLSSFVLEGGRLRVVGDLSKEAYQICVESGLKVTVEQMVDDVRLATLYRSAAFVLSPSLAEGHNLVIAEALGCGTKVVCSDIAAHREFYAGRVLMFDPMNVDDAINQIRAIRDGTEALRLEPASRSWSDVAASYRQVFESVAGGGGNEARYHQHR